MGRLKIFSCKIGRYKKGKIKIGRYKIVMLNIIIINNEKHHSDTDSSYRSI